MGLGVRRGYSNKMARNGENTKNKILIAFGFAFLIALAIYFALRTTYTWISLIIPEFLGVSLLAILITYAMKKSTSFKQYLVTLFVILIVGVIGFVYGRAENIRFLIDLSPELLGSTGLGLVFSIIFKKKVFQ